MKKVILVVLIMVFVLSLGIWAKDTSKEIPWVPTFEAGLEEAKDRGAPMIVCFPQLG